MNWQNITGLNTCWLCVYYWSFQSVKKLSSLLALLSLPSLPSAPSHSRHWNYYIFITFSVLAHWMFVLGCTKHLDSSWTEHSHNQIHLLRKMQWTIMLAWWHWSWHWHWPWMVRRHKNGVYTCGGILIDSFTLTSPRLPDASQRYILYSLPLKDIWKCMMTSGAPRVPTQMSESGECFSLESFRCLWMLWTF